MSKNWKKQEITYLKRYASSRRTEELAERFKTDAETVTAKLAELGLSSKDSVAKVRLEHDPMIKVYEKALKALGQGKTAGAAKLFDQVATESDRPGLADRARRYLAVCRPQKVSGPDDPFLEAVFERNRGRLDEALDLCVRGGRQGKDDRFAYLAASIHAIKGDHEKALSVLTTAIELNPKNRIHAYYDPDFESLRSEPEFEGLLEPVSA